MVLRCRKCGVFRRGWRRSLEVYERRQCFALLERSRSASVEVFAVCLPSSEAAILPEPGPGREDCTDALMRGKAVQARGDSRFVGEVMDAVKKEVQAIS